MISNLLSDDTLEGTKKVKETDKKALTVFTESMIGKSYG